jgi:hypothetical protein
MCLLLWFLLVRCVITTPAQNDTACEARFTVNIAFLHSFPSLAESVCWYMLVTAAEGSLFDHSSVVFSLCCRYVITTPALRNGTACEAEVGDTRFITPCQNRNPCKPVACNATWVTAGPCNGACNNGTGTMPEQYVIRALPVDNGANCTHPNNTMR